MSEGREWLNFSCSAVAKRQRPIQQYFLVVEIETSAARRQCSRDRCGAEEALSKFIIFE
jgi:hypothetical protein